MNRVDYNDIAAEGRRARGLYDSGMMLDGMGKQVFPRVKPFRPLAESLREYYSRKLAEVGFFPAGTPTLWRRGESAEIQDFGDGWGVYMTENSMRAFRWARFAEFSARHLEGRQC